MKLIAVLAVAPAVVVLGLVRPAGLLALVLLAVFVGAVARTGLWLLGDLVAGSPDAHALRVAAGTFGAGIVVATSAYLVGPLTLLLVVPATALAARPLLRPGRPGWLGPMRPHIC